MNIQIENQQSNKLINAISDYSGNWLVLTTVVEKCIS